MSTTISEIRITFTSEDPEKSGRYHDEVADALREHLRRAALEWHYAHPGWLAIAPMG